LKKLSLSTRNWICVDCNTKHDRDENASKNLELYPKFLGNKILKDQKLVEISVVNEICETGTKQLSYCCRKV
jgi:transposase